MMIKAKTNKNISVLALIFLFSIANNICSSTTTNSISISNSSSLASASSPVVTIEVTTTTVNCVDDTSLTFKKTKKNKTKNIALCEWASSSSSKLSSKMSLLLLSSSDSPNTNNNNKKRKQLKKRLEKKVEKRCHREKSGEVVKHHCQCTCAEFLTEDGDSNSTDTTIDNVDVDGKSSPTSLPISSLSTSTSTSSCPDTNKLLSGNSCVNSNNDEKILSCDYNYINITSCDTEIVVNTPEDTCECDAGDNNPIWECYKLDPVPCDVAPAPAPTLRTTRPTQSPLTRNLRNRSNVYSDADARARALDGGR